MLRPIYDRVVVRPDKFKETTDGGIHLPESSQKRQKTVQGMVIAVGPGKVGEDGQFLGMPVKINDRVVYAPFVGTEIEYKNEKLRILVEQEILAVVE